MPRIVRRKTHQLPAFGHAAQARPTPPAPPQTVEAPAEPPAEKPTPAPAPQKSVEPTPASATPEAAKTGTKS